MPRRHGAALLFFVLLFGGALDRARAWAGDLGLEKVDELTVASIERHAGIKGQGANALAQAVGMLSRFGVVRCRLCQGGGRSDFSSGWRNLPAGRAETRTEPGNVRVQGDVSAALVVTGGGAVRVEGSVRAPIEIQGGGDLCVTGELAAPARIRGGGSVHVAGRVTASIEIHGGGDVLVEGDVELPVETPAGGTDRAPDGTSPAAPGEIVVHGGNGFRVGGLFRGRFCGGGGQGASFGGRIDDAARLCVAGGARWTFERMTLEEWRRCNRALGRLCDHACGRGAAPGAACCSDVADRLQRERLLEQRLKWLREASGGAGEGRSTLLVFALSDLAPGVYRFTDADLLPGDFQGRPGHLPYFKLLVLARDPNVPTPK
ncbi:MAG: hypothetical protein HYZ53_05375 [Planctomycetes bacterium]|nr:hypothetical protein [Planctomycetota bacterium]